MKQTSTGKINAISDKRLPVTYDNDLIIATGKSRYEKEWKNRQIKWSVLLKKLSDSLKTHESHAEYMKFPKAKQDQIKDIGGFVGGHLKEGHRRTGYVTARQIITLDIDFPPENFWETLEIDMSDHALCVYSTHKHSDKTPRYRLIIPLDRPVSPDEYEAIARRIAGDIGIDYFDDSTYQPTRLMYWPSHSSDVDPFFNYIDEPFLNAREVLDRYPDWTDTSYWPESSRMSGVRKKQADKQGDPLTKKGIVGAFCRSYTIPEAIAAFLPEVYTPTAKEDRYTYAAGSTAAGLVVYDGEVFAYSNHSTDPAGGQLCNAFDLVRIHKFGDLDEGSGEQGGKKPSYKAMAQFLKDDEKTQLTLAQDAKDRALQDFADSEIENWEALLVRSEEGAVKNILQNILLILRHDEALKGIAFNELSGSIEVLKDLPWNRPNKYWRDVDYDQLYGYVTDQYGVQFTDNRFSKALAIVADERRFNPLRDYIDSLPEWDGIERAETLLIDYLGADDDAYTRAVTVKTLVAGVKRVYEPGCKFDTVLVLDGKPGIGKSTLLRKLGGEFFSDSLSLADTRDKSAAEKLQGVWIMEIGEMQGTRKADTDVLKGFLSRQVDEYRAAYGRVVERHPRTTIICGTTNSTTGFLRDMTGNRRYWPVFVGDGVYQAWDIDDETRDQIWAEAKKRYHEGETIFLSEELEAIAREKQLEALESDEREGEVIEYLDTLLPDEWYGWDIERRREYFQDDLSPRSGGTMQRTMVSAREIFCECFGQPKARWKRSDGYEIASIMARIRGWERIGISKVVPGYGKQRIFTRKRGGTT